MGPLLFNIFINDVNQSVNITSLRLYADDTTEYASDLCPAVLEFLTLNQDMKNLTHWFSDNFLQVNTTKTQAMTMGRSTYTYDLRACNKPIKIETTLKILGVTLDRNLTFKPHIKETLKKGFAKIAALCRIKHFVPTDVMLRLYKAYVLPHFEYCSPILLGIGKPLSRKLESANHYALKTLLNPGSSSDY